MSRFQVALALTLLLASAASSASAQNIRPTLSLGSPQEEPTSKQMYQLPVTCSTLNAGTGCTAQFTTDPTFFAPTTVTSAVGVKMVLATRLDWNSIYYFRARSGNSPYSSVVSYSIEQGVGAKPPTAPTPPAPKPPLFTSSTCHNMPGNTLMSGTMQPGQAIKAPTQRFELVYQTDGNLVVYSGLARKKALWASNTNAGTPGGLTMQEDGDLVMRRSDGTVAWSTKTGGNMYAFLTLQDDGNLVIYTEQCKALWARQ